MPVKQPIDLPTRQSVERLFKLLREQHYKREDDEYLKADKELDVLEEAFRNSKEYKATRKKRDDASDRHSKHSNDLRSKRDDVYRQYLAKGLTDDVRRQIEQLVAEYAK